MERVLEHLERLRRPDVETRDRFASVFAPLHNAVMRVHVEHHRLFVDARRALPHRTALGQWISASGAPLAETDLDRIVRDICEVVIARAREFEAVRFRLRGDAGDLLRHGSSAAEKRYLLSIIHYFLGEHYIAPSEALMDDVVHEVENRGGLRAVHPPHSHLIEQLSGRPDDEVAREALDQAVASINAGYTEVTAWFIALQLTEFRDT